MIFTKNKMIFIKIQMILLIIKFYSKNDLIRKKIAKNGKIKYFKLFNEKKVSKYLIDISLGNKASLI